MCAYDTDKDFFSTRGNTQYEIVYNKKYINNPVSYTI